MDLSSYDPIALSLAAAGTLVAALGFLFGLFQYRLGRVLDKAKFAAGLVEKFYTDGDLVAAWRFIDWSSGRMSLPLRYANDGTTPLIFDHTIERLAIAMSVRNRTTLPGGSVELVDEYRTPQYKPYVEIFDRLFSFIESIYGYYTSRIVDLNHLSHVLYLTDRLGKIAFENELVFEGYLAIHKYWRVIYMIEVAQMYYVDESRYFIRQRARWRSQRRIRQSTLRAKLLLRPQTQSETQMDSAPRAEQ